MSRAIKIRDEDLAAPVTAKEERFCVEYVKTGDQYAAYRVAYPYGRDESGVLLQLPKIQKRIAELKTDAGLLTRFGLKEVIERYAAIATADPEELVSVRHCACRHCHGDGHEYQWRELEYLARLEEVERHNTLEANPKLHLPLPDIGGGFGFNETREPHPACPMCDGEGQPRVIVRDTARLSPGAAALYAGAKTTRDGIEVKMHDQMAALDKLYVMFGGPTENARVQAVIAAAAGNVTSAPQLADSSPQAAAEGYRRFLEAAGSSRG